MSAGHRHGGERAASALADDYYDRTAALVAACEVVDGYDIPWLANRSTDGSKVYRDKRVPRVLPKTGIDSDKTLPWHELGEWLAENDGLSYDDAHTEVANPLERRAVEAQKPDDPEIWRAYSDEMDGYIRAVDDETIERVPADIDLRPFEDDDRKLLEEIIAAGADKSAAASPTIVRVSMPQKILKPSDLATRLKAGEKLKDIFFDASGARAAKLIGLQADVAATDDDRAVDFTISTGAIDRYNSTIAVKGWETENYNKNPIVLWAHDDSIPAIARADNARTEGGKLKSRAIFADRDTHALADTIYRLIKAKFISAASVGWIPIEWKFVEEEGRGFGVDYLRQELLEWSVVNIPANPECLVGARSMGIDTKPLLQWAERALDQGGMLLIPRDELEALRKAAGAPSVSPPALRARSNTGNGAKLDGADQFKQSAAALKTLFSNGVLTYDELVDRLVSTAEQTLAETIADIETRAGRVLSAANEKKLRDAHDHCQAACDHLMNVIEQNVPDDDPDDDTEHPEASADDTDAARAARAERVRQLKAGVSRTALAAAS